MPMKLILIIIGLVLWVIDALRGRAAGGPNTGWGWWTIDLWELGWVFVVAGALLA